MKKNSEEAKMDDDIIQAYLWNDVIRLGFQIKEPQQWIQRYLGSLQEFWEVSDWPCGSGPKFKDNSLKAKINNPDLELWWEFDLRIDDHFHLEFNHLNDNIWWHHSDSAYYELPFEKLLDKSKHSVAIDQFSRDNLEIILEAMIFHGRVHQHIKSPLPNNKIRIKGGIDNPFLYLFHLRYQLCPIKEKREMEKNRLIELFDKAIKKNSALTVYELLSKI